MSSPREDRDRIAEELARIEAQLDEIRALGQAARAAAVSRAWASVALVAVGTAGALLLALYGFPWLALAPLAVGGFLAWSSLLLEL